MRIKITVPFEIAGWEEIRTEETPEGAKLSEVKVTKKFAGELQGTSVATVLLCGSNDESGGGYIAQERFEGMLAGKNGSFVMQHGGIRSGSEGKTFGNIVPGCGSGELHDLRGEVELAHDAQGARLVLDYRF